MQDILSFVSKTNRPRLLVRTAKIGAQDYNRDRHLGRLIGRSRLPKHSEALLRLSEIETEINTKRINSDASYSVAHHVDLLIAMISEARLLRAALPQVTPQTGQSPQLKVVK